MSPQFAASLLLPSIPVAVTVEFDLPTGTTVASSWSSVRTRTGQHYRVTPASFNGDIRPGQEEDIGFNAAGAGPPLNLTVR